MNSDKTANALIHESSPYLLQHAYNPVHWHPWGKQALNLAKGQNKPILVSIGYSSCHWCHVMEKESFENHSIAELMNQQFICIKVDREERADIDQIYMSAVQAMGLSGGWPLNVFLTPDQKPFYGGTYFPPNGWTELLEKVAEAFSTSRRQLEESADKFTEALQLSDTSRYELQSTNKEFNKKALDEIFDKLSAKVDNHKGGINKAPKFPMPCIWQFILKYYHISKNQTARQQIKVTLDEMAYGGIYDQIGGGFARYSVDENWLVPHFEKMLYDNAQLISLYSEAYSLMKEEQYKDVVYETVAFLEREMKNSEGGFYSALDADSEGEEGKFYVWSKEELEKEIGPSSVSLTDYYNIEKEGNWEEGKNILHKKMSDENFAAKHKIEVRGLKETVKEAKKVLLEARAKRIRPGLDDKIITSWNAVLIKGLTDAYAAFGESKFLQLALDNANFIEENLFEGENLLRIYKNGKATINGYLEDYALLIQAYINLYQLTFHEKWLNRATELCDIVIDQFYDTEEGFFFFTGSQSEDLIARKKELFDNVIPASNSIMANNLYLLSHLQSREDYLELSANMLAKINKMLLIDGQYLANWASLYSFFTEPTAEIAIVGVQSEAYMREINQHFWPNKVLSGCRTDSNLPLLQNRTAIEGKTTLYLCYNKSCQKPVFKIEELFQNMGDITSS